MKHRQRTRIHAIELVGWIGVALILIAYILLSTGVLAGQSIPYQAMMLIGSGSIAVEAWTKKDAQPMVLNMIFMSIAFVSLIALFVNQ